MADSARISAKVRQQVANELGRYVYMLVDPETGIPFYVGKGQGQRFESHGNEAMLEDDGDDSGKKIQKIRAIRDAGHEPEIWIIRRGMKTDEEYTSAEAACIDLLRSMPVLAKPSGGSRYPQSCTDQLTNARREASNGHGIMLLSDLEHEMAAPLLETKTPLLIVTLGGWVDCPETMDGYGYKSEWLRSEERKKHYREICSSAAGWFKFSERTVKRLGIEYAVAAHRGVTRALMKIRPDSWEYSDELKKRRFDFEIVTEGALFDETVGEYGHRLPQKKRGEQTTFRYWPYK